jgi:hypothetical protein
MAMSEREEGYRAATETRVGCVERTRRGARSSADAVTRLVGAAVYLYEHQVPETRDPAQRVAGKSIED